MAAVCPARRSSRCVTCLGAVGGLAPLAIGLGTLAAEGVRYARIERPGRAGWSSPSSGTSCSARSSASEGPRLPLGTPSIEGTGARDPFKASRSPIPCQQDANAARCFDLRQDDGMALVIALGMMAVLAADRRDALRLHGGELAHGEPQRRDAEGLRGRRVRCEQRNRDSRAGNEQRARPLPAAPAVESVRVHLRESRAVHGLVRRRDDHFYGTFDPASSCGRSLRLRRFRTRPADARRSGERARDRADHREPERSGEHGDLELHHLDEDEQLDDLRHVAAEHRADPGAAVRRRQPLHEQLGAGAAAEVDAREASRSASSS